MCSILSAHAIKPEHTALHSIEFRCRSHLRKLLKFKVTFLCWVVRQKKYRTGSVAWIQQRARNDLQEAWSQSASRTQEHVCSPSRDTYLHTLLQCFMATSACGTQEHVCSALGHRHAQRALQPPLEDGKVGGAIAKTGQAQSAGRMEEITCLRSCFAIPGET